MGAILGIVLQFGTHVQDRASCSVQLARNMYLRSKIWVGSMGTCVGWGRRINL